jgi:hypothetical protein
MVNVGASQFRRDLRNGTRTDYGIAWRENELEISVSIKIAEHTCFRVI